VTQTGLTFHNLSFRESFPASLDVPPTPLARADQMIE
jgi:hypothetical protein